jgi:multiple sugar transport system permease protein
MKPKYREGNKVLNSIRNIVQKAVPGAASPRNRRPLWSIVLNYGVLILFSVLFIYPLLWMLASSLRSNQEIAVAGMDIWPETWRFENYTNAFTSFDFWLYLRNSLITSLIPAIFFPISSSLVAFAFARIPVPGKNILFIVLLSTMFLPGQVTIIPKFIIYRNLGMVNTLYPLFIESLFGSAFWIFLIRQFYAGLPKSLEEAAFLDGATYFQIWWKIFLPLSRPALIAVGVLTFMGGWNNFFGALVYLHSNQWKTLPLALAGFQGQYFTNTSQLMAVNLLVIAPMLLLFFFAQRAFIEGITFTGTKG